MKRDTIKRFRFDYYGFLNSPVWYLAAVVGLSLATYRVEGLWWLAALAALVWGGWLVGQMFRANDIPADGVVQTQLFTVQARQYQKQIGQALKARASGGEQEQRLEAQVEGWMAAIEGLAAEIVALQQQEARLRQEMGRAAQVAGRLQSQTTNGNGAAMRAGLEVMPAQEQRAWLAQLQASIGQAETQLAHILAMLGTLHAQLLIDQSTRHTADCARLATSVDEEVWRLQDHLEALREVKGIRAVEVGR